MKRWYTQLALLTIVSLALAGTAVAQEAEVWFDGPSTYDNAPNYPVIFEYESLEADTLLWGQYGYNGDDSRDPRPESLGGPRDYLYWANYADFGGDPASGDGALWLDWGIWSDQSWGGSNALQHFLPVADSTTMQPAEYYDFSDFEFMHLWHNTLVPAEPSLAFRIKIHDASEGIGTTPSNETEDWYYENGDLFQAQPGWNEITIPLISLGNVGPGSGGFSRPGCPGGCWSGIYGNGELDLDKVAGFQFEWVASQYGAVDDSSTAGTVVYDKFYVSGVSTELLGSLEAGADATNTQSNGATITESVSTDAAHGEGSYQIDYTIVGDQGWGGEFDWWVHPADGAANFGDLSMRTGISVFYKVLAPAEGGTFAVRLNEFSDGQDELWAYETQAHMDMTGNWQRLVVPFREMTVPSWSGPKDGVLDQTSISQIQMLIYTGEGSTITGSILIDRVTSYGFQETDFTAPEAVAGVSVAPVEYSNVISWADVPEEDGETYTIYVSDAPITAVKDADGNLVDGVLEYATVPEGTEVYVDNLYYPVNDGAVTKYYAISATDPNLNESEPTIVADAVTNNGRGITTIALTTPNFVADGDLSEWAGITPIHMEWGQGFTNSADVADPDDAADLSADVYIAMDDDYLYVGMDINDDVYDPVENEGDGEQWLRDVAEFYIGLYDSRGAAAANYGDFHYKVNLYTFAADDGGPINEPVGENYYIGSPATGKRAIEWRVSFATMQREGEDIFVPQNGMWVPLDIVIMDDDTPTGNNREHILTYSPNNNDNSWQSPANWFYTWIGDQFEVVVDIETLSSEVPGEFKLHSNYPNPFNPTTLLRYDLPQAGAVKMDVFNILGQHVATLVDTDQSAGSYEVRFDANQLASGTYLVHLRAGSQVQTTKMTLVR